MVVAMLCLAVEALCLCMVGETADDGRGEEIFTEPT